MATDWIRRMERETRGFGGELPVDEFLPELQAGHLEAGTNLTAERPEPGPQEDLGVPLSEREVTRAPGRAPPEPEAPDPQALEAEIREFMNRDPRGSAPDDDFSEFLGSGIDPNVDD